MDREAVLKVVARMRESTDFLAQRWADELERAASSAAQAAPNCPVCQPNGLFATDGTGPWDCYSCGRKATNRGQAAQGEAVARPDARIIELAERLVASGPKCSHLSASECHEISEYILELAAAPPAPPAGVADGWQPIETAPKDGLRVLLCVAGGIRAFEGACYRGRWCDMAGFERDPTHWMQMPKPAAPAKEAT